MKRHLLLFACVVLAWSAKAQIPATIDFETVGIDTAWYVFANGTDNPAYCPVADNPDASGINTSGKVGMLEVITTANPWAGMFSTTAITPFLWDETNSIVKVMVYKNVISNFDLKFEAQDGGTWAKEIKIPNTVTDEWEELSFDFSEFVGNGIEVARIVIIPDFPDARTEGSLCYFDNIDFGAGSVVKDKDLAKSSFNVYPNPASQQIHTNLKAGTTVRIYTLTGTLVQTSMVNSTSKGIDISELTSGMYIIKANNQSTKLFVQ